MVEITDMTWQMMINAIDVYTKRCASILFTLVNYLVYLFRELETLFSFDQSPKSPIRIVDRKGTIAAVIMVIGKAM